MSPACRNLFIENTKLTFKNRKKKILIIRKGPLANRESRIFSLKIARYVGFEPETLPNF